VFQLLLLAVVAVVVAGTAGLLLEVAVEVLDIETTYR
jgi:hypothetical protein